MGFLKISTSLLTWLVAETYLADGEILQVAINRVKFLKLRGRTRIETSNIVNRNKQK
jgi:hypothetical protein